MRADLCGFCGEGGCRLEIRKGSGDGFNKFKKVWTVSIFTASISKTVVIKSFVQTNVLIAQ